MDLMACVIFRKKKKHRWEHDERDVPSSVPSVVVASPEAPDLAPDFFAGGGDSNRPIKEKKKKKKKKKKNKQDKW